MKTKLMTMGAVAVFAMSGISSANLLTNGDFALGSDGTTNPDTQAQDWTHSWTAGWIGREVNANGTYGDTNNYHYAIGNSGAINNSVYQDVAGTAGYEYQLSVDAALDDWWSPAGFLKIEFLDDSNGLISAIQTDFAANGWDLDVGQPWSLRSVSGLAPAGTMAVRAILGGYTVGNDGIGPGNGGGTIRFDNANLEVVVGPFIVTFDPATKTYDTNPTVSATIVNFDSDYVSAELFLDGESVATDNTPSGTGTNVIGFTASGLSLGTHIGRVEIVGADPAVVAPYEWTFEIVQPAFESITVIGPTGFIISDSTTLEVEVHEDFETVENTSQIYLDGNPLATTVDRSLAPTTTISAAASGLLQGEHTAQVVVAGNDGAMETKEWSFFVVLEQAAPTNLLHHWAFDENSGSTVTDLVGSADGTIVGTNFGWVAGGLDLFGGGSSYDWNGFTNTTVGSYVDLPNGMASALPNIVTFEVIFEADVVDYWARLWDFGTTEEGIEDVAQLAAQTCYAAIGEPKIALSTQNPASDLFSVGTGGTTASELTHFVWVYDADNQMTKFYKNGVLKDAKVISASWPLSFLNGVDQNNWMGRGQWGDPMFNGKLYDFRIYSGIMTAAQVADRWDEMRPKPNIQSFVVSGGTGTLSWNSKAGETYNILSRIALTDPWGTNQAGIASAGDGTSSNTVSMANDVMFFTVEAQ